MRPLLVVVGIPIALVAVMVVWQLPELKRYLKIRAM